MVGLQRMRAVQNTSSGGLEAVEWVIGYSRIPTVSKRLLQSAREKNWMCKYLAKEVWLV